MLALYGPPGSGKSTIGRELARIHGKEHIDTDTLIVEKYSRAIHDIISCRGESYFRDIESNMIGELMESSSGKSAIISLGGGSLLRRENRSYIHPSHIIVLNGSPEILYDRITLDTTNMRPLVPDRVSFMRLLTQRADHYAGFAQQINIDDTTPEGIIRQIHRTNTILV